MRLVLRNKKKLVGAFGEAYYNTLIESIKSYSYEPDKVFWNEVLRKEMLDIPNVNNPDTIFTFAIISEMWDVVILAFYSENKPSK